MTDNNSLHPILSKLADIIAYQTLSLLHLSRISDNSKFCNGPVNFEITRFTCISVTSTTYWCGHRGCDQMVVGFTTTNAITTNVVSSSSAHCEVYSIQHHVIKFVSYLWQVCGFLGVHRFPPPIKLTAMTDILLKVALNTIIITLTQIPLTFNKLKLMCYIVTRKDM
jgi:hypothetical protein